jgi:hypothetical protein
VLFGYALFYQLLTTFVVKPSNTWIYQRPCLPFRTKASDKAELRILVHYDHRPVAKVDEEKKKEIALKILRFVRCQYAKIGGGRLGAPLVSMWHMCGRKYVWFLAADHGAGPRI